MIFIKKYNFFKFSFLISFLFLVSCDGKVPTIASGVSGPEGLSAEEASFAKFANAREFKNEFRKIINFWFRK